MSLRDTLAPVIREMLDRNDASQSTLRGGAFCAAFERKVDGEPWVQAKSGVLNIFYPSDELPLPQVQSRLPRLPLDSKCVAWEPWKYATFEFDPIGADDLTNLIQDLFVQFYGFPNDIELDSEVFVMR